MAEFYRRGWHPDPYGVHAERYFYADNQPGRLVRDERRIESYDDIPLWAKAAPTAEPPVDIRAAPPPDPDWSVPVAPVPMPASAAIGAADTSEAPPAAPSALPMVPDAPDSDYFPDETVPWRVRAAANLSSIPRPSRPSRRVFLVIGSVALAVVLASILLVVLPSGSDHSPTSAAQQPTPTNPQLRVPSNFLNGSRGTTTTTAARTKGAPAAATTATWSVTGMYAASSLNLVAVACPSATQCYAVGETTVKSAMVLASTDGGTTWAQQYVPVGGMLNAVACSSPTTCMAVGGTNVVSTTNGGMTWSVSHLGSATLSAVSCPSTTECVAAGSEPPVVSGCDSGSTYTTTNGGQSWSTTTTHCFVPAGIACPTVSRCVLVGTHGNGIVHGEIVGTADAGSTWRSSYVLSQDNTQFSGVSCPSLQVCVAVGSSPAQSIVRTADGGITWVGQTPAVPVAQRDFLAVGCSSALVCHAGGTAAPVGTDNGGASWSAGSAPSTVIKITGISCPSATSCVGVAIGDFAAPSTLRLSS